ncbi:DVU3141 family protein [Roseomonas sp. BN140053]|uniref:DVU3141 family protein n=1 Tax=Roseomonas sp. BN140053 TaxID=3391898 RepID=UPI0039EC975A
MNSCASTFRVQGLRRVTPALLLLALSACGSQNVVMPWDGLRSNASVAPVISPATLPAGTVPVTAVARPGDALGAFAARAQPGQQESVVLSDSGRTAVVQLVRSYNAASGRECRELLVGGTSEGRNALYCQDPAVGWAPARPLLRGGNIGRS